MDLPVLLFLLLAVVGGDPTDQGPQTFSENTQTSTFKRNPTQSQPRVVMKEVIMFLTPSQIKTFHSQGLIDSQHIAQLERTIAKEETGSQNQLLYQEQNRNIQEDYSHQETKPKKTIDNSRHVHKQSEYQFKSSHGAHFPKSVEEPTQQKFEYGSEPQLIKEPSRYDYIDVPVDKYLQNPRSYTYIHFFTDLQKKSQESSMTRLFYPQNRDKKELPLLEGTKTDTQTDPILQQKYRLIPYDYGYLNEKDLETSQDQNLAQISSYSPDTRQQNIIADLNKKGELFKDSQLVSIQDSLSSLQYAPQYSDQKYADDVEKILRNLHLEKQRAEAHAQAIVKSVPLVVHNDINIVKRRPVNVIKHVQVPVPTPYLVRIPEPFEVKVPQPYAVPLEIMRPIPIPIVKTEKIEVEKPVPVQVEKRIQVPIEKKVYVKVDKPYPVERIVHVEVKKEVPFEVPIHKPEKLTILRHVWEH